MASRIRTKDQYYFNSPDNDQFAYIEVNIGQSDTLLALSMKFNCTIIDLKRLNSLQNDRDMYALNSLKIPIKKHSSLAQQYENQLKYGDVNFSRLNTNAIYDPSLERDVYRNSEDDDSEDTSSSVGYSVNKNQNGNIRSKIFFYDNCN